MKIKEHGLVARLVSIWRILTIKNFILITVVEKNNKRSTDAIIRTDHPLEADTLTLWDMYQKLDRLYREERNYE